MFSLEISPTDMPKIPMDPLLLAMRPLMLLKLPVLLKILLALLKQNNLNDDLLPQAAQQASQMNLNLTVTSLTSPNQALELTLTLPHFFNLL